MVTLYGCLVVSQFYGEIGPAQACSRRVFDKSSMPSMISVKCHHFLHIGLPAPIWASWVVWQVVFHGNWTAQQARKANGVTTKNNRREVSRRCCTNGSA